MFSCILIDDEPHALAALRDYLSHLPDIEIVGAFLDPIEALTAINNSDSVDLVLLDVNMPKLSGVELASLIRSKTRKLVFTTGHAKYAYDAFEVQADAYLLKPYSLTKFLDTIQKLGLQDKSEVEQDYFFIKSRTDNLKMVKIMFDDILAVESNLNYIKICTPTKNVVTYMSLNDMWKLLSKRPNFIKVHRGFIIQTSHIKMIEGNTLELDDGTKVTVGENYRKKFAEFLNQKTIKAGMHTPQP